MGKEIFVPPEVREPHGNAPVDVETKSKPEEEIIPPRDRMSKAFQGFQDLKFLGPGLAQAARLEELVRFVEREPGSSLAHEISVKFSEFERLLEEYKRRERIDIEMGRPEEERLPRWANPDFNPDREEKLADPTDSFHYKQRLLKKAFLELMDQYEKIPVKDSSQADISK